MSTLKISKLKCRACNQTYKAEHETIAQAINTCKFKKCGLKETVAALEEKNISFKKKEWMRIDPEKVAHYPLRNCLICNQDVAEAWECHSNLLRHKCPLAADADKPKVPALLQNAPLRDIRDLLVERRAADAEAMLEKESATLEITLQDPVVITIDKKGYYHHAISTN